MLGCNAGRKCACKTTSEREQRNYVNDNVLYTFAACESLCVNRSRVCVCDVWCIGKCCKRIVFDASMCNVTLHHEYTVWVCVCACLGRSGKRTQNIYTYLFLILALCSSAYSSRFMILPTKRIQRRLRTHTLAAKVGIMLQPMVFNSAF